MSTLKHLDINGITYDIGEAPRVYYGTCDTTNSTTAKVVTCNEYTLTTPCLIGIYFTTANTAAAPTLNINSTGAIAIYKGGSVLNGTSNTLKWSAYTILYFLYDGTYYKYISSIADDVVVLPEGAGCWYGTSSTTASTATKASTITNFSLKPGAIVSITFSTANTYTSGAIKLNINSTGEKTIYKNNAATSSSNTLLWETNTTLTFVYSGSYWHYLCRSKGGEVIPEAHNIEYTPSDTSWASGIIKDVGTGIDACHTDIQDINNSLDNYVLKETINSPYDNSIINNYGSDGIDLWAVKDAQDYKSGNLKVQSDRILLDLLYGGTITLNASTVNISNVATPVSSGDAVNKNYVDTQIGTLSTLTSPSTINIVSALNSINILNHNNTLSIGDDLNDYTSPGIYLGEANIINNLSNIPPSLFYSDGGSVIQYPNFKLIVSELGTGMIRQQIISGDFFDSAYTGRHWFRYYDTNNNKWTFWNAYLTYIDNPNDGYKYINPIKESYGADYNYHTYDYGENCLLIRRNLDGDGNGISTNYVVQANDVTLGSSRASARATGGVSIRDGNGEMLATYNSQLLADGSSRLRMYSRNSGGICNVLNLDMANDNTATVEVSHPPAWRAGIGAAPILQRISIASNKSSTLTSGTNYNIASYTFPKGLWLISFRTAIQSNSTGRRAVFMATSSNGTSMGAHVNTNQIATNGATTNLGWMTMIEFNGGAKYYFNAYQNSGATLTCASYISAIKLDD